MQDTRWLPLEDHVPQVEYFVDRCSLPDWCIEEDTIDFHDFSFIYHGHATYTVDHRTVELHAGDLLYIPPGSLRSAITDPSDLMSMYAVNFNWKYPANTHWELPLFTVTHLSDSNAFFPLFRQINQLWLERRPGFQLEVNSLFSIVLNRCRNIHAGHMPLQDLRIVKIKDHILRHLEEPLTVEELAGIVALSPAYMGTLFHDVEGESVKSYIRRVRINYAESLLLNENLSVSQVAERCGFSDIYYFSKVYKQLKGVPPTHTTRYGLYR